MRLGIDAFAGVFTLATLMGACNSNLSDNPAGLRCSPHRTPPCAGGFICVDDLCVHPSQAEDAGAPLENSEALLPNDSSRDGATAPGHSGDAAPGTTRPPTRPDPSAGETVAQGTTDRDVTSDEVSTRSDAESIDTSPSATTGHGAITSGGQALTDTTNMGETGPSEPEPNETTDAPGPAPCLVSCIAPQDGRAVCEANTCTIECMEGRIECDGRCVDTNTDVQHCGACAAVCAPVFAGAATCEAGECGIACEPGFTWCNGACVNTQSDVDHCGSCGARCQPDDDNDVRCNRGRCEEVCPGGKTYCDGKCVNLERDRRNCGECGRSCLLGGCDDGACLLDL